MKTQAYQIIKYGISSLFCLASCLMSNALADVTSSENPQQIELIRQRQLTTTEQAKMATLQIPFIANQGQMDAQVAFYAKTFGGTVFVTKAGEIVYALPQTKAEKTVAGVALREELVGGAVQQVMGVGEAVTRVSYFKGSDPAQWQSNLPTYQEVRLGEVYAGIDVSLKAHGNNVEKLFVVQPGANPDAIRLAMHGAESVTVNTDGELEAATPLGVVTFSKPVAYQEVNGQREYVAAAYTIAGDAYGFAVGAYDRRRPLLIDPLLASTFLGGVNSDGGSAITLDSSGNVYVTGATGSGDFPTTAGAYDPSFNGGSGDVFIAKLNSTLSALLASTFLGGTNNGDSGYSITLDSSSNVYVTGTTDSSDFPTTAGAYDTSYNDSYCYDGFIAKLNSTLNALLASTFLGGMGCDYVYDITLDSSDNVYVTGNTSSDFPTTAGAYDTSYNGTAYDAFYDAFIAKFNSSLTTLLASTFLGGSDYDYGYAITLDSSSNVYVTGETYSSDFPTTAGAYDSSFNGSYDVFIVKLNSTLSALLASTFLGGANQDYGYAITLDSSGNLYVTGMTYSSYSSDFPTTAGAYDPSFNGSEDIFIAKLNSSLTTLLASTFLGGANQDDGFAITLDSSGNVYVTGSTNSSDFPTTAGAYDSSFNGSDWYSDVFIARLDSSLSALLASTFLGGHYSDSYSQGQSNGITLDSSSNVYVTGYTTSSDFPTTAGAYDPSFDGSYSDAFIARLDSNLSADLPHPTVPHFWFSYIDNQPINQPFSVTLTARDADGNIDSSVNGEVALSATIGQISPIRATLTNGIVTLNTVKLDSPGTGVRLQASGQGRTGESNTFSVTGGVCSGHSLWASITQSNQQPLAGAEVKLFDYQDQQVGAIGITGSDGLFLQGNLPCGTYRLEASKDFDGTMATASVPAIEITQDSLNFFPITLQALSGTYDTPVLLVPGILGSSSEYWSPYPKFEYMAPEPPAFLHIHDPMNAVGFTKLHEHLESLGFNVFACPWDWRYPTKLGYQRYLIPTINEAVAHSPSGKVHIVAHSMGGVLVREYIQSADYRGDIDSFLMVGTPNLGSPIPYYLWEGGDPKLADDILDSGVASFVNVYTNTVQHLWEDTYRKNGWLLATDNEVKNFIQLAASSLRQLMGIEDFLYRPPNSARFDPTGNNENTWLKTLNADQNTILDRMTTWYAAPGEKVRVGLFVSKSEDTLQTIKVGANTYLYEDGKPLWPEKWKIEETAGDGTVYYASAIWPKNQGWATILGEDQPAEHVELIKTYDQEIANALAGRTARIGAGLPKKLDLQKSSPVSAVVHLALTGPVRALVMDASGNRLGIDPVTNSLWQEIPNANMRFLDKQSYINIENPSSQTYTVTLFGQQDRDFHVEATFMDDNAAHDETILKFSGMNISTDKTLTLTLDPSAQTDWFTATPQVQAPTNLIASPVVSGSDLLTRLDWDASAESDIAGYTIYAIAPDVPYFTNIATVPAGTTTLTTTDLWSNSAAIPVMTYAVTVVKTSGAESFFSAMVRNNDRDRDRLSDVEETAQGTLLDNPDTDGDGLLDGEEVYEYGSNPLLTDSDGDTYSDYNEVQAGTDPTDPTSFPIYEINVKQGATNIPVGGAYNFGNVSIGSNKAITFTIENLGTALLNLTGTPNKVTISGAQAGDFSVTQQPSSPVVPGGSTTFIVRFAPTADGIRTATVSIANNDSDENPYTFTVTGQAANSYILWTK